MEGVIRLKPRQGQVWVRVANKVMNEQAFRLLFPRQYRMEFR